MATDLFKKFKEALKKSIAAMKGPGDPAQELYDAIEAADDWESLQSKLQGLRSVARRRQQEAFERFEPIAKKAEELLAEAKKTRIKVMKNNLLRQAEGYMQQLEAEDQPAEIHSATCKMLTNIIKQVQRAGAMQESTVTAEMVDGIAARLEDIVDNYKEVTDAAGDLEDAGKLDVVGAPSAAAMESRLSKMLVTEEDTDDAPEKDPDQQLSDLENRLYDA